MTYEFIATTKCNRNCSFCWVEKSSYVASRDDAFKFVDEVKKLECGSQRKFKISLFGGEPLLNLEAIGIIIKAFEDDNRCQINISTNGDLISQNLSKVQMISNVKWHVATYDFKTQSMKYLNITKVLNHPIFSYTFTETDIDSVNDFKKFAKDTCGVQYKIAFSHSPSSWNLIDSKKLKTKIIDIMTSELNDIIDSEMDFPIQSILADHYLSLVFEAIARIRCKQNLVPTTCLSGYQKMSFFNGSFVGKCMRISKSKEKELSQLEFSGCQGCDYEKVCTKSCIAEAGENGFVDEKLCIIEKACFDAISVFAESHQCNLVWRDKVLKHYLAKVVESGEHGLETC